MYIYHVEWQQRGELPLVKGVGGGEKGDGVEPTLICGQKQNGQKRREDGGGGGEEGKNKRRDGGKGGGAPEDGRKRKQRYNIRQPLEHNNTERDEY